MANYFHTGVAAILALISFLQIQHFALGIQCHQCFYAATGSPAIDFIIDKVKGDDFLESCENFGSGPLVTCPDDHICNFVSFTASIHAPFVDKLLGTITVAQKGCTAITDDLPTKNGCERLDDLQSYARLGIEAIRAVLEALHFPFNIKDFRGCYCDTDGCDPSCGSDSVVLFDTLCITPWIIGTAVGSLAAGISCLVCCIRCCRRFCCCCRRKKDDDKHHLHHKSNKGSDKEKRSMIVIRGNKVRPAKKGPITIV